MEELLKLAKITKENHPYLLFDVDSILSECIYWVDQGRDEDLETSTAIDNINSLIKQSEEWL